MKGRRDDVRTWTACIRSLTYRLSCALALAACSGGDEPARSAPADSGGGTAPDAAASDAFAPGDSDESDGHADSSPDGAVDADASPCGDFGRLVCGAVQTCAPFWLTTRFGDADACASGLAAACDQFAAAGTPLDEAGCARALAAPDCHAVLTADSDTAGIPALCLRPRGSRSAAASCGSFFECQSLSCAIAPGALCGVCLDESRQGEACDAGTAVCEADLVCNGATCVPPATPGSPCGGPDVRCPGGTSCSNGTCQPYGGAGAPCGPGARCDNAHGFACRASTCAPVTVAAAGQPCGPAAFAQCGPGLFCYGSACVVSHGLGGSCGPDAGTTCDIPYWCDSNVCTYMPPDLCPQAPPGDASRD